MVTEFLHGLVLVVTFCYTNGSPCQDQEFVLTDEVPITIEACHETISMVKKLYSKDSGATTYIKAYKCSSKNAVVLLSDNLREIFNKNK